MPRSHFTHYERSQRKKKRKRLDSTALAKATGLQNTAAFERLVRHADAALDGYDRERARDETRHLLAGIQDCREKSLTRAICTGGSWFTSRRHSTASSWFSQAMKDGVLAAKPYTSQR